MKKVAIIQARMGSTRLPGKTLADIGGQPLAGRIIDRVAASRLVDEIVVATTTEKADDELVAYLAGRSVPVYRGSVQDVLDRFHGAAESRAAEIIIRITADDPFKDPDVIDLVTGELLADPALDYASNTIQPTFPEGLDVEVFRREALTRAWSEAKAPSEREHVTPYIWKHPHLFRIRNVRRDGEDLSGLRWTLDYDDDLKFAREIYARLGGQGLFKMKEILELMRKEPQLGSINSGIPRNQGYLKSVQDDLNRL
jgi:spore coat polysaccharide biosynthesis protein SpsF (cytidylyltransferase family)